MKHNICPISIVEGKKLSCTNYEKSFLWWCTSSRLLKSYLLTERKVCRLDFHFNQNCQVTCIYFTVEFGNSRRQTWMFLWFAEEEPMRSQKRRPRPPLVGTRFLFKMIWSNRLWTKILRSLANSLIAQLFQQWSQQVTGKSYRSAAKNNTNSAWEIRLPDWK